jgi:uncharacterized protein YjbI with pentapeptide repeats
MEELSKYSYMEQLTIFARLKKDVLDWNKWRDKHPDVTIDLRKANLSGLNLSGFNLSKIDFSNANIRGTNFTQANLQDANFFEAEAGLQWHWRILKVLLLYILVFSVAVALLFALIIAFLPHFLIFQDSVPTSVSNGLIGFIFLLQLIALGFITIFSFKHREGFVEALKFVLDISDFYKPVLLISSTAISSGFLSILLLGIAILAKLVTQNFTYWTAITYLLGLAGGILIGAYVFYQTRVENNKSVSINKKIAVKISSVGGTKFESADLTNAKFDRANLGNTDFRKSIIKRTSWVDAKYVDLAILEDTILSDSDVRNLLITAKTNKQDLSSKNFRGAYLVGVNLSNRDLSSCDFSDADLRETNLAETNLSKVQALGTNFQGAQLTGAFGIALMKVDEFTNLENVICKFAFPKIRNEEIQTFEPGEFTIRYREASNVFELVLRDGMGLQTFFYALRELNIQVWDQYNSELFPTEWKALENKLIVKILYPEKADPIKLKEELDSKMLEIEYVTGQRDSLKNSQ